MNGDRLTLRPEATAGIVRAMIEHNALYNGPLRLWTQVALFRHERPQKGRYRAVPPDRRRGARLRRPRRRRRADPDVPRAAARPRPGRRPRRAPRAQQPRPAGRAHGASRRADRPFRAARRRCSTTTRRRRLHTNPLRILDSKNPAMQAIVEAAPQLMDFLGAASLAHFDARARAARRRRPRVPRQPASGARPRLLQPHRVRVGHRPARLAGHGLRRRPLRRPVRAARRQADAGGRLGHGHRARCCCCSRRSARRCRRRPPDVYAIVPDADALAVGDARPARRCARPASRCRCTPPAPKAGAA